MPADQLIDLLESRELLSAGMISQLRKQVDGAKKPISPAAILKALVEKGHLTTFQAKKLLAEVTPAKATSSGEAGRPDQDQPERPPPSAAGEKSPETTKTSKASSDDDDLLGLAPIEEDAPKAAAKSKRNIAAPSPVQQQEESKPKQPEAKSAAKLAGKSDAKDAPAEVEPSTEDGSAESTSGLIDDLLDESLGESLGAGDPLAGPALAPAKKKRGLFSSWGGGGSQPTSKRTSKLSWESPIFLLGGGALVILLLLGGFLYMYLRWGSGDERFQAAEELYRGQSYQQAIAAYDKFLSRYGGHTSASLARVKIGLAKLRLAVESEGDWPGALETAKTVLPPLETEKDFEAARSELASLLPDIVAGLAEDAKVQTDPEAAANSIALAREAMKLVDNPAYLPSSLRKNQQPRIEAIEADLSVVLRRIERGRGLGRTIQAINKSTAAGNTRDAYAAYSSLLQEYPGLADEPELAEVIAAVSQRQGELVKVVSQTIPATSDADHEKSAAKSIFLYAQHDRTDGGGENRAGDSKLICIQQAGALYGIDAATGDVLWRHWTGVLVGNRMGPSMPVHYPHGEGQDFITREEGHLVRRDGRTGSQAWRFPFTSPGARPAVHGGRVLVSTLEGRLFDIDGTTGEASRYAQFPQSLAAAPTISDDGRWIFQAGNHSNLFALEWPSLECAAAVYTGHRDASVVVPPVFAFGHVVLFENAGIDFCLVHAFRLNDDGTLAQSGEPIRLQGNIVVPADAQGSQIVVVSDLGSVVLFEVSPTAGAALRLVAQTQPTRREPAMSYFVRQANSLWVADRRLTAYELQPQRQQIVRRFVDHDGAHFTGPLQVASGALMSVRAANRGGARIVSAVDLSPINFTTQSPNALWSVSIAPQPAGPLQVSVSDRRISYVGRQGDLFAIDGAAIQQGRAGGVLAPPWNLPGGNMTSGTGASALTDNLGHPSGGVFALPDGELVMASPPMNLLLWRFNGGQAIPKPLELQGCRSTARPLLMEKRLLVPSTDGQVCLVDPTTGRQAARPFMPSLTIGDLPRWISPAAAGVSLAVIADEQGRVHLLEVTGDPSLAIISRETVDLGTRIAAAPAIAGQHAVVLTGDAAAPQLAWLSIDTLATTSTIAVDSPVVWGPHRIGNHACVATADGELSAFDPSGQAVWQKEVPTYRFQPAPVQHGKHWLLAAQQSDSISSSLLVINPETGDFAAEIVLPEPLGAGPTVLGSRVLVPGRYGSVMMAELPEDL